MLKFLAIATVSAGLATSAFAIDNRAQPNAPSDQNSTTMQSTQPTTTDPATTGSIGVNGQNGAVGANASNSSTMRSGTKCADGGADATNTGSVTSNPTTSSGSNGTGTCQ